jgi:hypothetical protein
MEKDDPRIYVVESVYRDAVVFDRLVDGRGFVFADVLAECFSEIGEEENQLHWKHVGDYLKCRKRAREDAITVLERD